jgi:hypothetical protein
MNRFQIVVTTLVAGVALGFTLRTLGEHEVAGSYAAPASDPTPYTAQSERIPSSARETEPPPSF